VRVHTATAARLVNVRLAMTPTPRMRPLLPRIAVFADQDRPLGTGITALGAVKIFASSTTPAGHSRHASKPRDGNPRVEPPCVSLSTLGLLPKNLQLA
jgi:hypothetical protein